VSFVKLHQLNTSREIWVVNCDAPEFIAKPHFFNIFVDDVVRENPCLLVGEFGNAIRDELSPFGWVDACPGASATSTILSRGGLIQIQETLGDNSTLAQFY